MSRYLFAISIAAAGIGLAGGSGIVPRVSQHHAEIAASSAGLVAGPMPLGSALDDSKEGLRREIRSRASGTYIDEILRARDSALARWPDRHGDPLRVWIQPSSRVADWTSDYVYEVHEAFVAWDTLNLPVHFEMVPDSADALVHVTFIDHFDEPISGRTRWARDENYWITDANIVLAVHHRTGEILEDDAMHAMALHEIGHLLGLDHSHDPTSIMAPKVRVRSLSEADRATARLLYSLPAGRYSSR